VPLVPVIGADDVTYAVAFVGQDVVSDASGSLDASAVPPSNPLVPQQVLAANPARVGFLFQNTSENAMILNEINANFGSSWVVEPGAFFPPFSGYAVPTGAVAVVGSADSQAGDTFAAREWTNA
jgi:hypothetical protein